MSIAKANVLFQVPSGASCEFNTGGYCRFCIYQKEKKITGYTCALYNEALLVALGSKPQRCSMCKHAKRVHRIDAVIANDETNNTSVEQQEVSPVQGAVESLMSPRKIGLEAIKAYQKHFRKMMRDGFPLAIAEKVAVESVVHEWDGHIPKGGK